MKYISSNPNVLTGRLVIAGTRIPVARLLLKGGHTPAAIQEEYPHLTLEQIQGAVDELIKAFEKLDNGEKILQT
jgi:uncharacterized protein (DUF433 family)